MTQLTEYRSEIDLIDKKLVELLEKRLDLSKKLVYIKKKEIWKF